MDEQPTEDAPHSENSPHGENAPPASDAPPSENAPAASEHSPPSPEHSPRPPEHSPPSGDSPAHGKHSPHPTISPPLRADLCRVFVLGFLDAMKDADVNEDDEIEEDLAETLVKLAEGCINHSASVIAQLFLENPQTVFQTVYGVGFEACLAMNLKAAAQLNRN